MELTITLSEHELSLLNCTKDNPAHEVAKAIREMISDKEYYFGMVRWCDTDIEEALVEFNIEPTDENIALVHKKCQHHFFADHMIETGWDIINAYIQEIFKR